MLATRIELLQGMPVFGALRESALQCLLAQATLVQVAAGSAFFHEGAEARSMFVLEAGSVVVLKRWQQRDFVLHTLGAGDCFGEMSVMDLQPRSASVRAEAACSAIELCSDDLLRLYESDVEQFALLQMNMGREVCRRLRHTDELLFRARMGEALSVPEALFRPA